MQKFPNTLQEYIEINTFGIASMSFLNNNLSSMVISRYLSLFPSLKLERIVGVLKVLEVDSTVFGGTGTGIWGHRSTLSVSSCGEDVMPGR